MLCNLPQKYIIKIMILLKYVYNIINYILEKRTRCEDNHGEKITMMRHRSTDRRSTVDSRRRLTNFKMLVSQSVSAVLKQSV